jgi:hypothetical protein
MLRRRLVKVSALLAVGALAAAGCASRVTGPSVMVLPGSGKPADQFFADDARCRQLAARDIQTTEGGTIPAQGRYDMTYMQCMYAAGHQIPGTSGGWRSPASDASAPTRPPADRPPPPGAPPPPPPGSGR